MDSIMQLSWLLMLAAACSYVISLRLIGPYHIHITQLETCKDEGTGEVHFDNRINYIGNNKHVYNSPFRFMVPIDENFTINLDAQKWSNQGWRPRAFLQAFKGCKAIEGFIGNFFRSFYKSAGYDDVRCPFPLGNFTANTWEIRVELDNIKVLPYGKYKTILIFTYNNKKTGCLNIYLDIIPKKE